MSSPNSGIPYVPEGTLDPAAGLNDAIDVIDGLLQTAVISMNLTAPPGAPSNGDLYVVDSPATGAWAGHENDVARYVTEGTFWQFFEAGTQVRLVVNRADGGIYRYNVDDSPPSWQIVTAAASITISHEDAPTNEVSVTEIVLSDGLDFEELSPGVVRIFATGAGGGFAEVVNETGANLDATPANAGNYTRFTHASPTYTFDDAEAFNIGDEYHGRYEGAGSMTIVAAGGMAIIAPFAGSLEIPPGGTFTVKIVAADEADLFGVTVELGS